jgi:hypothetical protein
MSATMAAFAESSHGILTVGTVERDPMGREVGSFEEADASPHRPGFRTTDAERR